jgi:hypothetical protein
MTIDWQQLANVFIGAEFGAYGGTAGSGAQSAVLVF